MKELDPYRRQLDSYEKIEQQNFDRWKPQDRQDWYTVEELARLVERSTSWIRRMDRNGQLPTPARVRVGRLSVRLWSPDQAVAIFQMFRARESGQTARGKHPANRKQKGATA